MYELWDVETGNLVGEYGNEVAALSAAKRLLGAASGEAADYLALLWRTPDGRGQMIAESADLVRRARDVSCSEHASGHTAKTTAT